MTNEHTSTSSAGSEDSPSQPMLPGMIPESSASKMTTAQESSTDIGPVCQSSGTSGSLTAASGEGQTSSQVDFHVKGSPMLEKDSAQEILAGSGKRCIESFAMLPRATSWQKMFLASLLSRGEFYSSQCVLTWKMRGTRFSRSYFQLVAKTPRTDEIESGLWPTPASRDYKDTGVLRAKVRKDGKNRVDTLGRVVGVEVEHLENPGSLNPTWVEWLMGYPSGWTDLKPSETP